MSIKATIVPIEKLEKLQRMALVKYQRSRKRYDLALAEWMECRKPFSIEDNLQQYKISRRILTSDIDKHMLIIENLQTSLEVVQNAIDLLKNNPEQASILHESEIETAREKMEIFLEEFKTAERRYKELKKFKGQAQS